MKRLIFSFAFIFIGFTSISQSVDSINHSQLKNTTTPGDRNSFDWNNILAAIIGGLIGLTPTIVSSLRKSQIKGKIVSQYGNKGNTPGDNQPCLIYFQKMSVFAMNKNFSLEDIEVFIKYPNRAEIECKLWTWRNLIFTFPEGNMNIQKRLNISSNEYLLHYTLFPKDQSITGYISFTHSPIVDEPIEYIRYVFIDFKDIRKELKISAGEIKSNALIHDDSIWV
jgi:hypothetical protein